MLSQFPTWSAPLLETAKLSSLSASTIGIDASHYLSNIGSFRISSLPEPAGTLPEPLVSALGGVPFGLSKFVQRHLEVLRANGIEAVVVFDGLDVNGGPDGSPARVAAEAKTWREADASSRKLSEAWNFYDSGDAMTAVDAFRRAGQGRSTRGLYRFFQTVLRSLGVKWFVAPYSAAAQLHYFQKNGTIDTIYGASEALLYEIPELITNFDFQNETFVWVRRRSAMQLLGANVNSDIFLDACLLAGSDLLPSMPQLELPANRKDSKLRSAGDLVKGLGNGSGNGACLYYTDSGQSRDTGYLDAFRKARLTVKHHIVMKTDGKTGPLETESAPGLFHQVMGARLPDELYYYFSRGIIGARVVNWLVTRQSLVLSPLDGGDSEQYRTLVQKSLTEMQVTTIGLLGSSMHHYYANSDLTKTVWFDQAHPQTIQLKREYDAEKYKAIINSWHVPVSTFGPEFNKYQPKCSVFGLCVKALQDKSFAASTVSDSTAVKPLLVHKDELLVNSIWRMLHILAYVDASHNLTPKGQILLAIVSGLPLRLQENALLATELLYFKRLNTDNVTSYPGVPATTSEIVRRHVGLISKVACLGTLMHQEIGYTGVLGRNVLAWMSFAEAVRMSVRDLAEVCLTTLLLNGDAERGSTDLSELGLDLPFVMPLTSSLGVAVAYHLTECAKWPEPKSTQARKDLLADEEKKFFFAMDLPANFGVAWELWDAVNKGVQSSKSEIDRDVRDAFKAADDWLAPYR